MRTPEQAWEAHLEQLRVLQPCGPRVGHQRVQRPSLPCRDRLQTNGMNCLNGMLFYLLNAATHDMCACMM